MKCSRAAIGFLIAPIIPAIFFGVVATCVGGIDGLSFANMIFVISMWFLHAILFSYVFVLAVGIPGFYILNRKKIYSGTAYTVIGAIIGLLLPLGYAPFEYRGAFGIEWWVWVMSTASGFLAASTFWFVAVRGSNKSLKDAP